MHRLLRNDCKLLHACVCVGPELSTEVEEDADADEFEVELDEVDEGVGDEKKDGQQKQYVYRGLIYFIMCQHSRVTGGIKVG